jgi:hypothetical protein
VDCQALGQYNHQILKRTQFPRHFLCPGVFARLVAALVFKTSGGFEQSSLWVRFPYTPDDGKSYLN